MVTRTLSVTDRQRDVDSLARLLIQLLPQCELQVTVEEAKRERTDKQRASLFGVAYASLMNQMGLRGDADKEQLHSTMCGDYFGWIEKTILGRKVQAPRRTTTKNEQGKRDVIDTKTQLDFYAFIQQRAAEYGYDVPDPDPEWFRKAEREAEMMAMAGRQKP